MVNGLTNPPIFPNHAFGIVRNLAAKWPWRHVPMNSGYVPMFRLGYELAFFGLLVLTRNSYIEIHIILRNVNSNQHRIHQSEAACNLSNVTPDCTGAVSILYSTPNPATHRL